MFIRLATCLVVMGGDSCSESGGFVKYDLYSMADEDYLHYDSRVINYDCKVSIQSTKVIASATQPLEWLKKSKYFPICFVSPVLCQFHNFFVCNVFLRCHFV